VEDLDNAVSRRVRECLRRVRHRRYPAFPVEVEGLLSEPVPGLVPGTGPGIAAKWTIPWRVDTKTTMPRIESRQVLVTNGW
jgi:hypothetical protein